jgi:predicted  nucleic acid-binding Zn-ribbon protein
MIEERYKKWLIIGICFALFLWFYSCNNNKYQKLQGEYTILKENYTNQQKDVVAFEAFRLREKESLQKEIDKRVLINKELSDVNKSLEDKIRSINSRVFVITKDLSSLVNYYNNTYRTDENKVVENKVGLGLDTAMDVANDLEEGFRCAEIIPLKDEQLKNKDSIIGNLNKDKVDIKKQLTKAEQDIENRKLLEKSAEDNINNLKEQVNKIETKSTLNKILIPAALGAGIFLGKSL